MLVGPQKSKVSENKCAKPYCQCFKKREPVPWKQVNPCSCGEDVEVREWKWQQPEESQSWVVFEDNQKQVTFHPFYSSGTAAVRGDSAFSRDHHYYWEIKMLTDTYGTDIMVGIGTDKVNIADSRFRFTSLLGEDEHSYGLSYKGAVRHDAKKTDSPGFCRGSIVGVRVDMWQGTLEFYLNRKPQGISFYNLRRHQNLFPMVCSTAAQSTMRLIYAASWRASLLVDAAKILSASVSEEERARIPPGLWRLFRPHFWMLMPTEGELFNLLLDVAKTISTVCSITAQSTMRLIYAASWRASLLVDAAKILSASVSEEERARIPPGLWRLFRPHFCMLMPTEGELFNLFLDVGKTISTVCSIAAESTMRLIYAASWRASLLVDAAKILSASVSEEERARIPPGLWRLFRPHFWMLMPTEDCVPDTSQQEESPMDFEEVSDSMRRSSGVKRRHWQITRARARRPETLA
ncbi:uncharacterized protein LOC133524601 isoform X2 [Cydia pomonella]|uniref:uncharacterized protein LOC133524601 isoform X2 n=1 Tax=Cydia pomonella TaxID=82600 RepID=UPI002ADD6B3E|nr:uncharacterized protein LOC133524601 isoform X2 [Cydia pomonella]